MAASRNPKTDNTSFNFIDRQMSRKNRKKAETPFDLLPLKEQIKITEERLAKIRLDKANAPKVNKEDEVRFTNSLAAYNTLESFKNKI